MSEQDDSLFSGEPEETADIVGVDDAGVVIPKSPKWPEGNNPPTGPAEPHLVSEETYGMLRKELNSDVLDLLTRAGILLRGATVAEPDKLKMWRRDYERILKERP